MIRSPAGRDTRRDQPSSRYLPLDGLCGAQIAEGTASIPGETDIRESPNGTGARGKSCLRWRKPRRRCAGITRYCRYDPASPKPDGQASDAMATDSNVSSICAWLNVRASEGSNARRNWRTVATPAGSSRASRVSPDLPSASAESVARAASISNCSWLCNHDRFRSANAGSNTRRSPFNKRQGTA